MHQLYIATHDVKFPDCRQYTKPGDVLLFNSINRSLSIFRAEQLIGTVEFSSSGLQEFLRLGWITKPEESKKKPADLGKKKAIPEAIPEVEEDQTFDHSDEPSEIDLTPLIKTKSGGLSEERVIEAFEHKPRKSKKS